jgi:hypothetical protein
MPELCRFYGIIITMYRELGGRHHYPHIHTQHGGFKAVFNLPDGELMEGELPRKETRLVQAWIELHLPELMDNWQRLNITEGLPSFTKIAPL